MASTFKRKAKAPAKEDATSSPISMLGLGGTKSWTGGITLTSSGLRDLDGILGGGQPLGTCILIEEDRWTCSLASTLVRYWCAEAIAQNQHLVIPIDEQPHQQQQHCGPSKAKVLDFLNNLPFNLHWEKQRKKMTNEPTESAAGQLNTLTEEDEDEEGESNEEGLKIAWQYRKEVQDRRLGLDVAEATSKTSSQVYCHSYDLSKNLSTQMKEERGMSLEESVRLDPIQCCGNDSSSHKRSCGFRLFKDLLNQVDAALKTGNRKVVRLLLDNIHPDTLSIALPLLLVQIRMRQLPVVVLVSLKAWKYDTTTSEASRTNLHRSSDVVLQTEGFASRSIYPPPPEFRHLHGLVLVRKVSTAVAPTAIGGGHYVDLTISKRPPANIYGLKRDRRKLNIVLLHIPPEDHTAGGSVGGGGVRSGAGRPPASSSGRGCSNGDNNQNSLLSF